MEIIAQLIVPSLIAIAVGYCIGSLNFSIILTKLVSRKDIRTEGSGNAGATNVLRAVGKKAAILTFVLDFLKCVCSILIGYHILKVACEAKNIPLLWTQIGKYSAGIGCMLGHIKPLYFHFKGGKGVTTAAALVLLLDWRVFIPAFLTFLIVFAAKRIVSLASILGMGMYPVYTFLIMYLLDYQHSPFGHGGAFSMPYILAVTCGSAVITLIVVISHHANIKRLIRGEEKPLSSHKKQA